MAPLAAADQNRLVEAIRQSVPVDVTAAYDASTLRGKTVLITGGSSGLGAAFARAWASHGANIIIGDISSEAGQSVVADLRSSTSSAHHHFIHCDVTSWPSQAALFQRAVALSPTGELDAVVASAGITDKFGAITGKGFENPAHLDQPNPPAPDLSCVQVNLIGVMYTAHLALFWLQQNTPPDSQPPPAYVDTRDARDRHLLLIGSSAGLFVLPGIPQYITAKHGVTGLFRSLRTLSYRQGIRVNMLCPYFVDTPILPTRAVAMLAGLGLARLDDTVDAATRLMAAPASTHDRIAGRALWIGPRMEFFKGKSVAALQAQDVTGEVLAAESVGDLAASGQGRQRREPRGQAVWEVYAHDYETADYFVRRYLRLLNTIAQIKGWIGFWRELWHALFVRKPKPPPPAGAAVPATTAADVKMD
ncbi:hypothetical protein BD289DRAFT_359466 [Coniella lustricola]|uniref:5'-hydroxyaverantin dehydrogenase n=1 Tax=Coniella lustricola TaxID=2025994 RepID=A0A2T3ALC1_9PEZI|nr:hypothetical protein BD289DRAFT_359466 [Coniella lustricola]